MAVGLGFGDSLGLVVAQVGELAVNSRPFVDRLGGYPAEGVVVLPERYVLVCLGVVHVEAVCGRAVPLHERIEDIPDVPGQIDRVCILRVSQPRPVSSPGPAPRSLSRPEQAGIGAGLSGVVPADASPGDIRVRFASAVIESRLAVMNLRAGKHAGIPAHVVPGPVGDINRVGTHVRLGQERGCRDRLGAGCLGVPPGMCGPGCRAWREPYSLSRAALALAGLNPAGGIRNSA